MCGIVGVYNCPNASNIVRLSLHNLQHRGEESVGISSVNEGKMYVIKKMGLVGEKITEEMCNNLPGNMAIGHVRYSTEGGPSKTNVQPLYCNIKNEDVAIVHNGHIEESKKIRKKLSKKGSIFFSSTDTEIILHLLNKKTFSSIENGLIEITNNILKGSFSLILMTLNDMYISKDRFGIRPLIIGTIGSGIIVASESCAIESVGGRIIREVYPSEVSSLSSIYQDILNNINYGEKENKICIFEYIYFSRPDSILNNISIYESRINLGRQLAKESPADADIVISAPDSGNLAAIGFSKESKIPFEMGIFRNHYTGRTFIQPTTILRNNKINMKLFPVKSLLRGKNIVLVDDSIVRGYTMKKLCRLLKESGVKKIHIRISSPPFKYPCNYGIDVPKKEQLISSEKTLEEIEKTLGCDSLKYISFDGMKKSIGIESFCSSCFDGKYLF